MQVIKKHTHEIFYVGYSSLLHLKPEDFIVSEDAGIEPWTVATLSLTARRSNHSARSHARDFYVSFFHVVDTGDQYEVSTKFKISNAPAKEIILISMPTSRRLPIGVAMRWLTAD